MKFLLIVPYLFIAFFLNADRIQQTEPNDDNVIKSQKVIDTIPVLIQDARIQVPLEFDEKKKNIDPAVNKTSLKTPSNDELFFPISNLELKTLGIASDQITSISPDWWRPVCFSILIIAFFTFFINAKPLDAESNNRRASSSFGSHTPKKMSPPRMASAAKNKRKRESTNNIIVQSEIIVTKNLANSKFDKKAYLSAIGIRVHSKKENAKIKSMLGMSFKEFKRQCRLKKAEELLKDPTKKTSEICNIVGYKEISSLSKCIAKEHNMTLSDFRQAYSE